MLATDTIDRLEREQREKREKKEQEQQDREDRNQTRHIFIKQINDIKDEMTEKFEDLTNKREYFLNIKTDEYDEYFQKKFESLRSGFMIQRENIDSSILF